MAISFSKIYAVGLTGLRIGARLFVATIIVAVIVVLYAIGVIPNLWFILWEATSDQLCDCL
jgi:hypothetical protein